MSSVAQPVAQRASSAQQTRIASYLLTEYLERLGVEVIFGLCGHTNIAFLEALGRSRIRFITTRHEQMAAHAADGYARASGKVGVCLTHLGPGLTNAVTGIANAALDSIPMVVIAGDVPSYYYGRHPHQEMNLHQDADQYQVCRPFCKRVYRVDRVADLPRVFERAFHLAQSGRPGPVLVDVPMDLFSADLAVDAFDKAPPEIARIGIDPATAERIVEALATARRPVLYAGGGVISANATRELAALAEALARSSRPHADGQRVPAPTIIPCSSTNRLLGHADLERHVPRGRSDPRRGHAPWPRRIRARGIRRFTFEIPPTRLIHIDVDLAEIGRNYPTELGVVADARVALEGLAATRAGTNVCRPWQPARAHRTRRRSSQRTGLRSERRHSTRCAPSGFSTSLRKAVPEDGYIVTDVGWNKNGVGQQFPITVPGTSSPRAGSRQWGLARQLHSA
jgi:acetolactate synthase-1/2/3 large subunit